MKIMVNGQLVEAGEAVVSAYDYGYLYGLGLFETFRTYRGRPFLLEQHLARLNEGCAILGIPYSADPDEVREQIAVLLAANGLEDASIRYSVSAGSHEVGLVGELTAPPTVVIYVKPLMLTERWYRQGRPVQLLNTLRPAPETGRRLKSFHYMNGWLAKRELVRYPWAGEAEGLQVNERQLLTEGIVSNVFFMRDGILCTPSLDTGALPGITRGLVLRLAGQDGLTTEEGAYRFADLDEADEMFLTNSVQEIVPVSRIYHADGSERELPAGAPGPVTRRLMQLYKEQVKALTN
jgi:4-amino-4-deoxychorismate lyase